MKKSVEIQILEKIKKKNRGTLFFTDGILEDVNPDAVRKALERLVKSGELERVATGIYVRPVIDNIIGKVLPTIEEITSAIVKRDKARVVPTGNYAMYKLGLTTQVPLNIVYYSDTSARKINIGKQTITFKKASSKNLSLIGEISKLAIQALRTIGKDKAREDEIKQIRTLLKKENSEHLHYDLQLAPVWIRKLIAPYLHE